MNLVTTFTFLLLLSLNQILADEKVRYDNFQVYRLTPRSQKAVQALRELEENGYDFWTSVRGVNQPVDVMVPPHYKHRFNDFIRLNEFDAQIYIPDVQKLIDNERPQTRKSVGLEWTDYHTLDEINDWLKDLASTNDNIELVTAGKTYEGRDILGVKVSFKAGNENRTVFIESNIHAREWISSAVTTWMLNEILTSKDSEVRQVAESHDWYFVPVFNPDGFVYTHTTDRLWRKTRVPYSSCYGADPNRNWDYHFNDGGASPSPCSETYCGPKAFSEPTTKSLSEFITTIAPKLQAYIAFHSYSQLLLLPYGYTSKHLENYQELYDVGVKAATSLAKRYGTKYEVGNIVDVLYVASGGSMDWVKGTFGTRITYTYELRDTGRYGFVLPPDQIIPTAEETFDSLVTILQEFDKS
ncbi:Zinc carboxypeptidase A 1-like Protein [Tribolium castaneum]|uniref:Zinc carboxypeptidase A 1 n=3 Tax=Tribolium castaneum TaxID=7070 RepID=D2A3Y2_TRICA|nr:PREDICTED: zinc carboxypeptidase [Tribolium castaneum]EFA05749.1 Zinc carboxypeptidase A 1-like Protein [Tribolium castaneum]|eukprot:XP_971346.1 PREDICTED: zinc carboxypeptidase [Tribolium castaneum]